VVTQLYQGLTETCGGVAIQDLEDLRCGIAGVPLPSNEVKLESCPEINDTCGKPYLVSDREDHEGKPVLGRGKEHEDTMCCLDCIQISLKKKSVYFSPLGNSFLRVQGRYL
jgi:hypothetical protein